MKHYWVKLSGQITALFIVAILASFIPDYAHDFFGDKYHCIPGKCQEMYYPGESHYHWGWRHYLWCFMAVSLFIVQAWRIGVFIYNNNNNNSE